MSEHSQPLERPIIIMGVSGSGKSTIGRLLSIATGLLFFDGDDFHSSANIKKMASGAALNDEDRRDWILALKNLINEHVPQPIIIACSALKADYRDVLNSAVQRPKYVFLQGSRQLLTQRLAKRAQATTHFMPVELLDSQLSTLEIPTESDTLTLSIDNEPDQIVQMIMTSHSRSTQ